MEWHQLHPGFVCSVCHFELNDKQSHTEHMELHKNKSSPFDCVICDRSIKEKWRLRSHVVYHVSENNFIYKMRQIIVCQVPLPL